MYIGNYRLVYAFALCMYVQTSEFGASVKLAPNYGRTLWSFLLPAEIVSQCKGRWECAMLTTAKIHHTFMDNFPGLFILEMKTRMLCNPQRFRHWISLPANTLYPISINPGECAGPCLLAIILAWAIWPLHYELAVFGSDLIIDEDDVTGVGFVITVGSQYVLMKKQDTALSHLTSWVTFNFIWMVFGFEGVMQKEPHLNCELRVEVQWVEAGKMSYDLGSVKYEVIQMEHWTSSQLKACWDD